MTWEWAAGLRGYLHPTVYAVFYKALALLHCDTGFLVAKGPQLLQACFAALADVSVHRMSSIIHGPSVARSVAEWKVQFESSVRIFQVYGYDIVHMPFRWTLACQLASWFNGYCLVRTYSNSIEAALTALGMAYFLIDIKGVPSRGTNASTDAWKWMLAAALCVVMRPPSAIFWAIVAGIYIMTIPRKKRLTALLHGMGIGCAVLGASFAWDRVWYGRWVCAPWNFLSFNLLEGGSQQFGGSPWHWNFTVHGPTALITYIPLLLLGVHASSDDE